MTFIVATRPVVAAKITFAVLSEEGQAQQVEFVAHYRRHDTDSLHDLQDALANRSREVLGQTPVQRPDGSQPPAWRYVTDADFILDVVAGWRDVQSSGDTPLAFDVEALRQVLSTWPEATVPLFNGFFEAHRGARQKN